MEGHRPLQPLVSPRLGLLEYIWIDPRPGQYNLRVRAIDGQGRAQARSPDSPHPEGATGQQAIKVTVV